MGNVSLFSRKKDACPETVMCKREVLPAAEKGIMVARRRKTFIRVCCDASPLYPFQGKKWVRWLINGPARRTRTEKS